MNGIRLTICETLSAAELRRRGRQETDRAAAARMMAIANALEGMTRAEAARLAGMERQALRDAVVRYNAGSCPSTWWKLVVQPRWPLVRRLRWI